ncbi:MAG: AAA family ATPase [Candidatus Nitrosopelagicus sp.]|nr:AAA family ATPase [Candidatus Nitrosopelagicus sp.]
MRLRRFRIRAFRCIHDSGDVTVGDLAAFVGRNESGKTTILQGLILLNRDEIVSELDLCDEMVEELKSEINVAEGVFELNEHEREFVKEKFPSLDIKRLKIFRTNKNPEIQYDFEDGKIGEEQNTNLRSWQSITSDLQNFIDTIPNHIQEQLDTDFFQLSSPPKTIGDFKKDLQIFDENIKSVASEEEEVVSEWNELYPKILENSNGFLNTSERLELEEFIKDNLHPRIVYFSDYKKILGNINLQDYLHGVKSSTSGNVEYVEEFDRVETVRNLFYLAELELDKLEEYQNSPSKLIKLLNQASKKLTSRLNPAWKGEPIHVELRFNPGNIMSVIISDVHRDGTITNTGLLNRRAEGFKWTFSFIINFAAETQRSELKEAILLLDEPARNLHPTQQRGISDLLKNLAGTNQVLYATHSPFMIFDYTPGNLLVVELERKKHLSKIYYEYWKADDATLIPILYGLSRGLVESTVDREIGSNSRPIIIVETMSDTMYLNAFDKFLQDPNISMNPLNVIPAYNKNSVLPLAIFYRDHGYNTFILLDNDNESKQIAEQLKNNKFSEVQTIFFEREGKLLQSIEDYMVTEDYLYAVNQTYEIKLRKQGFENLTSNQVMVQGKKGVVENLTAVWDEHREDEWGEFEKEEICRYVCEKIALGDARFLTEKTKDQVRTLYRLIAERIRQHQNSLSNRRIIKK